MLNPFSFLSTSGRRQKAKGRHEETPAEELQAIEAPPAEEEEDFSRLFEDTPPPTAGSPEYLSSASAGQEAPDPETAPQEPEAPAEGQELGWADFEAGARAYREQRFPEALEAFLRAAGAGHRDAQFLCGQMYQRGIAAEADPKAALTWYKRAAKQGHVESQLLCAALYEEGCGTAQNLKRALFWYEQAAKLGVVKAQLKCGSMYYSGRAETRSPKKARRWLETAASNGSEEAARLLSEHF